MAKKAASPRKKIRAALDQAALQEIADIKATFVTITAWSQQVEKRLDVVEQWLKARVPPPEPPAEGQ